MFDYEKYASSASDLLDLMDMVETGYEGAVNLVSECDKQSQVILHNIELNELSDEDMLDNVKRLKELRTERRKAKDFTGVCAKLGWLYANEPKSFEDMKKALRCVVSFVAIMDGREYNV